MNKKAPIVAVAAAALMCGCFPTSIHPLYTEEDLAFAPSLVGLWHGDESETWNFTQAGEKQYRLVYTDREGKIGQFNVHRMKLGDGFFLDFYPDEPPASETNRSDLYQFHFVPVHSFAKISETESAVQLSFMSLEWLGKLVEKDPKAVRIETYGETNNPAFVFTASTKELQKFVLKHSRDKEAFTDPINLKRKPAESKKPA